MSKVAQLFDMQNDKTVITVFAINIINVGGKHLKLKCVAIVVCVQSNYFRWKCDSFYMAETIEAVSK